MMLVLDKRNVHKREIFLYILAEHNEFVYFRIYLHLMLLKHAWVCSEMYKSLDSSVSLMIF